MAEFGPSSQISVRVATLKTILATKLAPRILLPAVTKCYSEVLHTRKVKGFSSFCTVTKKKKKRNKQAKIWFSCVPSQCLVSLLTVAVE